MDSSVAVEMTDAELEKLWGSTRMGTYFSFWNGELRETDYGCGCCSDSTNIEAEDTLKSINDALKEFKVTIEALKKLKKHYEAKGNTNV